MHRTSELFRLLENEAQLAQCTLESGFTEIASASLEDYGKGHFYAGAFQISIALERIMKITVILKRMTDNKLIPPSNNFLRGFKHDLIKLYKRVKYDNKDIEIPFFDEESDAFCALSILSDFAKGDRYYNLENLPEADTSSINPFVETDDKNPLHRLTTHLEEIYISNTDKELIEKEESKIMGSNEKHLTNYARHPITGGLEMICTILQFNSRVEHGKGLFIYDIIKIVDHVVTAMKQLRERCHLLENEIERPCAIVPFLDHFFQVRYTRKEDALTRKSWITTE